MTTAKQGVVSQAAHLADQLRRAVYGAAWHGPALLELLKEVPVDLAPAKPLEHAHSIWEIVHHITAWHAGVRRRLAGERVELTNEQDWPPITDVSERAWSETLERLRRTADELIAAIAELSDAQLAAKAPGRDHDVHFMLDGLIQHDLYHAGQIAILKKSSR